MNDVERFLAHAVQLEREAARRYEDLSAAMGTEGNAALRAFFNSMARYSRQHMAQAARRAAFRELPALAAHEYAWPEGTAPETAGWAGVDALMDERRALELALDSERRGHAYYAAIAATTADAEVRALAQAFTQEEAEHVAELEKLLARCAA